MFLANFRKFRKIHENLVILTEFRRFLNGFSWKFVGISRNFEKISEISCNFVKFRQTLKVYYTLKNKLYFKLLYTFTSPRVPQASPGKPCSAAGERLKGGLRRSAIDPQCRASSPLSSSSQSRSPSFETMQRFSTVDWTLASEKLILAGKTGLRQKSASI